MKLRMKKYNQKQNKTKQKKLYYQHHLWFTSPSVSHVYVLHVLLLICSLLLILYKPPIANLLVIITREHLE